MSDGRHNTRIWYQVEFFSNLSHKWVSLFARESTEEEARHSLEQLKRGFIRIIRVIQTIEVISDGMAESPQETTQWKAANSPPD